MLANTLGVNSPIFAEEVRVFIGTYDRNVETRGIYTAVLDERHEKLSPINRAVDISNAGFLVFSPDFEWIYAVCGEKKDSLVSFQVENVENGTLKERNRLTELGKSVCHLALDSEWKNILTAHYGSAEYALFSLNEDHTLNQETQRQKIEGSGPNTERQKEPHPHSVRFGEKNRFYVPDLGTDKVWINCLDVEKHTFSQNEPAFATVEPGSGPRHICFTKNGDFAYVANELSSTVTVFRVKSDGGLETVQTLSTLPEKWSENEGKEIQNTVAEVTMTPDGRFLYVSNRGHDSIACFKMMQDGKLTLREIVSVHGKVPRHFAISPTGKHLLVANQETDNLTLFHIHSETGKLEFLAEYPLPASPVCVLFGKVNRQGDAELELAQLPELKKNAEKFASKASKAWKEENYPWTATMKSLEKMEPSQFPEELMLARLDVEKLDELNNLIDMGFAMEKRSKEGTDRDFVREVTLKAVRQHAELLQGRLASLNFRELKAVQIIPQTILENLKHVLEWYPSDSSATLCAGWMAHFSKVASQKNGEDSDLTIIRDAEAQNFMDQGIELAMAEETGFENRELLADSVMARAIWTADKNPEKSLADMELAVELNPELKDKAYSSQLLLYIHTKNYEKALQMLDTRMSEMTAQAEELLSLVEAKKDGDKDGDASEKPNPEMVREKLKTALKQIKIVRIEIFMEMENWEDVLNETEELLKTSSQDLKLLQYKLNAQINLEKLAEAVETLSVMIDENPLDAQLYTLRGQIYMATEKPELALEDFNQAAVVDGNAENVWTLKIASLIQLKRYDEAQKEMDAQLEKDPENPALLIQLGTLQISCENYQKALEFGLKAEKVLPPLSDADDSNTEIHQLVYQYLANWYLMAGEHAEAVKCYEKFITINAENALILNNLAWVLCTSPDDDARDGKRAVELAKKAVEMEPSPGYISTLAAAYAETGDFKMAIETVNRGIKDAEGDTEMTASLEEEKASYEAEKPVRERTETYKGKKTE